MEYEDIKQSIERWVKKEVRMAQPQGIQPKQMKKGVRLVMKKLEQSAMKTIDELQEQAKEK